MKVNGAQHVIAHELLEGQISPTPHKRSTHIPHIATRTVAPYSEVTNGASIMDPAKMQCEIVHAVSRVGLYFSTSITIGAILAGGRGVKSGFSSSGGLTIHGSMTEPANVIVEKAIRDMLPIRPTWPRVSSASLAAAGASYRRYISPTHVVL
jgi:hypothetical protein